MTAKELAKWEKEHGSVDSHLSGLPLLKCQEAQSPNTEEAQLSSLVSDAPAATRVSRNLWLRLTGKKDNKSVH